MNTGAAGLAGAFNEIPIFACFGLARAVDDGPSRPASCFRRRVIRHSGIFARTCSCTVPASTWNRVSRATATGRSDHRRERTQSHRLQQFLRDDDLARTRFVGFGVGKMRIVSPTPCCSSTANAAVDATMPCCPCRPRSGQSATRSPSAPRSRPAISSCTPETLHETMIWSRPRPSSSARAANRAPIGSAPRAVGGIPRFGACLVHQRVTMDWSSDPSSRRSQPASVLQRRSVGHCGELHIALAAKPTLPGLIRYFASASAQAGSASN